MTTYLTPDEQRIVRGWVRDGGKLNLPAVPHHGVTEWSTNPPIWVAGDEWGVTVTTADGHRVDLPADLITDLGRVIDNLEPIACRHCPMYADPDSGDDQTCREHTPSRRWKG